MEPKEIYEKVHERYGLAAKVPSTGYGRAIARAFGYTQDELSNTPKDANLGLSCGNPLVLAKLREGETVIDLGCGAGFDVFLAANRVGANGRVIGIDMNKEMLERASRNKEKAGAGNTSFIDSVITDVALPNWIADCIISNCVVNLVPEEEKQMAFNGMFRLLKPGGRLAISDILIKTQLPEQLKTNMALYLGCIAGASLVKDYEEYLREAGFGNILIVDSQHDLNVYTETNEDGTRDRCCISGNDKACCEKSEPCCNAEERPESNDLETATSEFKGLDLNKWAGSFQVYAVKS